MVDTALNNDEDLRRETSKREKMLFMSSSLSSERVNEHRPSDLSTSSPKFVIVHIRIGTG